MKILSLLLLTLFTIFRSSAQNEILDNEPQLIKYLEQSKFDIDTNADAIILHEIGKMELYEGKMRLVIARTIKLLGKKGIEDYATINLSKEEDEWITKISATTYNVANGKIIKQKVEKSDILNDKVSKDLNVYKFNLPSVKEGSIIYYTYVLEKPEFIFIPEWNFQNEYPTLCSQYEVVIPTIISFTAIERVLLPFVKVEKSKELIDCQACSLEKEFSDKEKKHIWVRRNIPAFENEPYMSNCKNHTERVKIHITGIFRNGYTEHFYKNWDDFSKKYYYKNNNYCGQVFQSNNFLNEKVLSLQDSTEGEMDRAKKIFRYVRHNYRVQETAKPIDIKEVFTQRMGSIGGINLLLIAMLRKANLSCEPVLLATRSSEKMNSLYPEPKNINYLVGKLTIDNKDYYLDASDGQIPFGVIDPACYNGYCRVINEIGSSIELHPDMVLNKSTIMVLIKPAQKQGKMLITINKNFGIISGMENRKEWLDDTSKLKEIITADLQFSNLNTKITNYSVKNLYNPDEVLSIQCKAELEISNEMSTVYFDPYFYKFFAQNPYVANNRKYKIEMDYREDINYVFRLQLPSELVIIDYPKSANLIYRDEKLLLKNILEFNKEENTFNLNSRFIAKTTQFEAEENDYIKRFYNDIIAEQNKKIVIKRVN